MLKQQLFDIGIDKLTRSIENEQTCFIWEQDKAKRTLSENIRRACSLWEHYGYWHNGSSQTCSPVFPI